MARKKPSISPGPKPERLQIQGDWKQAVADALKRGKPPSGLPDNNGFATLNRCVECGTTEPWRG